MISCLLLQGNYQYDMQMVTTTADCFNVRYLYGISVTAKYYLIKSEAYYPFKGEV